MLKRKMSRPFTGKQHHFANHRIRFEADKRLNRHFFCVRIKSYVDFRHIDCIRAGFFSPRLVFFRNDKQGRKCRTIFLRVRFFVGHAYNLYLRFEYRAVGNAGVFIEQNTERKRNACFFQPQRIVFKRIF